MERSFWYNSSSPPKGKTNNLVFKTILLVANLSVWCTCRALVRRVGHPAYSYTTIVYKNSHLNFLFFMTGVDFIATNAEYTFRGHGPRLQFYTFFCRAGAVTPLRTKREMRPFMVSPITISDSPKDIWYIQKPLTKAI
jgi:hypothetical protein